MGARRVQIPSKEVLGALGPRSEHSIASQFNWFLVDCVEESLDLLLCKLTCATEQDEPPVVRWPREFLRSIVPY